MSKEIEILPNIMVSEETAEGFQSWITSKYAEVFFDYVSQEAQRFHAKAAVEADNDIQYGFYVLESQKNLAKESVCEAILQIPDAVKEVLGLK